MYHLSVFLKVSLKYFVSIHYTVFNHLHESELYDVSILAGLAVIPPFNHPNETEIRNIENIPIEKLKPGQAGTGVTVNEEHMADSGEKRQRKVNYYGLNYMASAIIPRDRDLPDWRNDWCRSTYHPNQKLVSKIHVLKRFF